MNDLLFHPGLIEASEGISESFFANHPAGQSILVSMIDAHVRGQYGDTDEARWEANDVAVMDGGKVESTFVIPEPIVEACRASGWSMPDARVLIVTNLGSVVESVVMFGCECRADD